LYLIASGQVTERQEAAALLGVHRNTIGRWLSAYEQGGLAGLLEVKPVPGATPTLTSAQQAQLRERLADPAGFPSYHAVQAWVNTTFGVEMKYPAIHRMVRYKLGAKLKVPRPTHQKKRRRRERVSGEPAATGGGQAPDHRGNSVVASEGLGDG
jgi:transposase